MRKRFPAAALAALAALAAARPALLLAQAGAFRFHGPLSRVLTPNGDARNDRAVFCFDNPSDSEVTGRIYTLLGAEVAATAPRAAASGSSCPSGSLPGSAQLAVWDGRASGQAARSGLYVYRISSEDRVFTGTLVVVR